MAARSGGLGSGSEFVIRLPRLVGHIEPQAQSIDALDPAQGPWAMRVMIVDDNVDAVEMLTLFLKGIGYEVSFAYDAKSALDLARAEPPRVMLLDIGLPDLDGYELAKRVRSLPQTADAVLIALTGYGQPEDQQRSASAGFDHHFTKPADATKLATLLAEIRSAF